MNDHPADTSIRAFIVTVPREAADVASDRLWQLGVRAVEERDLAGGVVELRTSVGRDDDAVARAAAILDPNWSWRTEDVSTAAAQTWRDFAVPNWVADDLVIVPAWLDLDVPPGVTAVMIEPGGAFGLGDHPTSQLTAGALRRELARRHPVRPGPVSVLDVGCGTGVLAVVAALSGAAPVRAVDIAGDAVEATAANAALNGVADQIVVDDTPVGEIEGEFAIVVANILAPVLVAVAADLRRLTAIDGRLIISGILAAAHGHVIEALHPMVVVDVVERDGWVAVTLGH